MALEPARQPGWIQWLDDSVQAVMQKPHILLDRETFWDEHPPDTCDVVILAQDHLEAGLYGRAIPGQESQYYYCKTHGRRSLAFDGFELPAEQEESSDGFSGPWFLIANLTFFCCPLRFT